MFRYLESTQNSQKFEVTFQFPRLGPVYTCAGKFLHGRILFLDRLFTWIHRSVQMAVFFLLLCCYWSLLMLVVYHLPRNSGNFGWDGNGKAVWFARTEIFQNKRNVLKGSPKFPNGISERKYALTICHSKPVPGHTPICICVTWDASALLLLRVLFSSVQAANSRARTSKVVLFIRKCNLNSSIA